MVANICHHGWARALYLDGKDNKEFVVKNEAELKAVAMEIGLSDDSLFKILEDIDLKDRKIVIIYKITPCSNFYLGVNKIESALSKVNIVQFCFGLGCGLAFMSGKALILSTPENINKIHFENQHINVLNEPEYEEWNYQEVDNELKESIKKITPDQDYELDLKFKVGRHGLSEEEIKKESFFLNASEEKQAEMLEKFPIYRKQYLLNERIKETFISVRNRLIGKSY